MKPTLSLSSCWLSHRHTDGFAMIQEMVALGFSHVELSHGIRISLVPGILKAVQDGIAQISSVHNFCPLPTGITTAAPNLFMPSSGDTREADQWLRHTKRTIDFAAQVGARVVVLHLGCVEFLWFSPGKKLRAKPPKQPGTEDAGDDSYKAVVDAALARMRKRMPVYWTRTKAGIESILAQASERGVKLGVENREKFEELPLDADFPEYLKSMSIPGVAGYWHDAGHAHIKEQLGVINHEQQLEANAANTLGFHIHDTDAKGRDHQPLGKGEIDFEMVSRFWKPEHLIVLEFSPRLTPEEIVASRQRVEELLSARFGE
ncbi:MAG TPA: sugar phosphate isomerase/epimerase [Opitutaceae bacterium]|nr:sugar phosphate isomerase/epimerase [Opitutaceae bacterium]